MIKLYPWSKVLNHSIIDIINDNKNQTIDSIASIIISNLNNLFDADFYKYLKIVLIRSGSINNNLVCQSSSAMDNPYFINNIELIEDNPVIINKIRYIIMKESSIWRKVIKYLKDSDIDYVYIPEMFECDIINYLSNRTIVNIFESDYNKYIISASNNNYESIAKFSYNILKLDKLLTI